MKSGTSNRSIYAWQGRLLRFSPYLVAAILFLVIPSFLPAYIQSILTKVIIFALFAMSLDIVMGYTGLLSLGHAAYFGVGAYTVAIMIKKIGIQSFWITAPAGIIMAALFAAILGVIALRVSGIYFLLVTLALSMLIYSVAEKWYSVTGGVHGITGIPRPDLGIPWIKWDDASFYYFVFIVFIICYYLMYRLVNSPFGLTLRGIREEGERMSVLGYNVWLYRYLAFIIGGLFAGVAGILSLYHNGIISPFQLTVTVSALGMLICIIGGLGTLWGPIIGSIVIILVEFFSSIYVPQRWPLVLGCTFVIAVIFLRGGIAPHLHKLWRKIPYGSIKG